MSTLADQTQLSLRDVERFLYTEARLADEHDYDGWEGLWTQDALYWVPANGEGGDPTREMSVIYDNRSRIATRIRQLKTGRRYAQTPPSRTRRLLSNIEMQTDARRFGAEPVPASDVEVQANFLIVESRSAGMNFLAGRATYHLRPAAGEIKMSFKKVVLINNDRPLPTMSFLI
jgi:3-phenylpropionate/cinnamic acid dioxygenase small subunit